MKKYVAQFVKDHGEIIVSSIYTAHEHFFEKHRDELPRITGRARSNLISDYMYTELEQNLKDDGFAFIRDGNRRFIGYRSQFLMKIKKLKKNLKASYIYTVSALKFQYQLDLGFIPSATNLYLGFIMNKVTSEIDRIVIVCPNKFGGIDWHIDLGFDAQPSFSFPRAETDDQPRRISPKQNRKKGENKKNGGPA